MSKTSIHFSWLQLIEVSGPFVSTTVLNEAFPDGLDGFDKRTKRDLSRFYSEWIEAYETKNPDFPELHAAWIRAVLREGLQFQDGDLSEGSAWSVAGEGGLGSFAPELALKDIDGKPCLFFKSLPADAKPEDRDISDVWKDTVLEKMTRLCRAHEVRLGLVTNGEKWILVNAATGGTLSGTATWYARLWFQEDSTLRAFLALLGYRRFVGAPKKRLPYLLDESLKHLEEVTDTLGKQVMTAVEVLMEGFDRADLDSGRQLLAGVPPTQLYEAALTVMMRLVFLLCAEERGLMLLGEKKYDDVYAVSTLRKKLEEESDKFGPQVLERRYDAWARLLSVFRLIYSGVNHPDLRFPAMGGSLFNPDKYPFLEGRLLGFNRAEDNPPPLPIDNRTVLLLLESLQVLKNKDGAIPLSFRSLDVEQIGYIYEGLLEFTGAQANEILLGLKGDKSHQNPEVSLSQLESLRLDSDKKLVDYVVEMTGRTGIPKEYAAEPDLTYLPYLSKICRGDKVLEGRVRPFLNWLRTSEWGEPVVYHKGSFFVTEGRDRRSSGTHYTPKQLTEMEVREALEPIVYIGPALGWPRSEWKLRTPAEILALKVCDVAMGSGAFLVQVCRYLADRLLEAWALAEKEGKAISSDGSVTEFPPNDPMSKLQEDRLCEARRLVAEKCLYGVDINPLAVELAKLSLWLITTSKGRPFSFLDHNLKCGDSLLGISDVNQLIQFRMKPDPKANGSLMSETIRQTLDVVLKEREEIRSMRDRDITDIRLAETTNTKVENLLANIRDYADYFIGEVLVAGKLTKKTAARLDAAALEGEALLSGDSLKCVMLKKKTAANLAYDLPVGQTQPRRPFHWAIEFPEVFAQGGFNAIVGNPPFMGGKHLKTNFGGSYRDFLGLYVAECSQGAADLVAYFYLRSFILLRSDGCFALIASNSISEGDTRQLGLEQMVLDGATIISAHPNMPWPGTAAVYISPITIFKGAWRGDFRLSDSRVETISVFLSDQEEWTQKVLVENESQSYIGTVIYNSGFVLTKEEAEQLIRKNIKNQDVIFPYLNGENLNSTVSQTAERFVINFFDWPLSRDGEGVWGGMDEVHRLKFLKSYHVTKDYPFQVAEDYPDVLEIVRQKVRPEREKHPEKLARERWWCFQRSRPELYHVLGRGVRYVSHPGWWVSDHETGRALVLTRVSKTLAFAFVENNMIFSDAVVVFGLATYVKFSVLQSSIHAVSAWKNSSKMKTDLRYSPSDCYETFPFPKGDGCEMEKLGKCFDANRRAVMISDQIGLTQLYNKFHDPNVEDARFEELRQLQVKIDNAVRDAYGWTDLDLEHGFHEVGYLPANDNIRFTISESARIEVLKRLAKLNKERWEEEEAAGLHKKGKK